MSSSASNLRMLLVLLPLISFVQAARMVSKHTTAEHEPDETCSTTSRSVKVLVTRHGLSCANLIDKFSKGSIASKMHVFMWDPLLSAAGAEATQKAGDDVTDWLEEQQETNPDFKVDAVLASHLARAWQTAALQYPNFEITGVPFISESGLGRDNQAKPLEEQEKLLKQAVDGLSINLKWLQKGEYGQTTKGNWDNFRTFLADHYLPDFVSTHPEKKAENPIVLATVTHSNFMNSGEIKKKCGHLYPKDAKEGKAKANNNQVVLIPYIYKEQTCGPEDNRTVTHVLADDEDDGGQCSRVAIGTGLYGENGKPKPLCQKDIGATCEKEFTEARPHRWGPALWPPMTLEGTLEEMDAQRQKLDAQFKKTIDAKMGIQEALQRAQKKLETTQKDTALQDQVPQLERELNRAQAAKTHNDEEGKRIGDQVATLHDEMLAVQGSTCWLGGNPANSADALAWKGQGQ